MRAPLGTLESRKLDSANASRSLPGAPDGEYVVIHYDSRFEDKTSSIETVVMVRESKGAWRAAACFIK